MSKRILITGGAGFVGHHLVEHVLKNTDWHIIVLDKLTYASSGFDRLRDILCFDEKRVTVLTADFNKPLTEGIVKEIGDIHYIVHMGAETHVDRSIDNPEPFVVSNVLGTMHMLDFARRQKRLIWFVMFSTDEVYGPAAPGVFFKETDRYNCTNPYSATKAGAEQLALAYANTYRLPLFITNTMNVFGERQHPEKFIPSTIYKARIGQTVKIHSDSTKTISGSRFYIHARNVAAAVLFLLEHAKNRESYNVVGDTEITNLDLAKLIADILGKPLVCEMVDFHSCRPGHDLRYALDGTKMKNMGWSYPNTFGESLVKTVLWTLKNEKWLLV
jgi:dTDP-glucose 4,6-dehydratase